MTLTIAITLPSSLLPQPQRNYFRLGATLAALYLAAVAVLSVFAAQPQYTYFDKQGIVYRTDRTTGEAEYQWGNQWRPVITKGKR